MSERFQDDEERSLKRLFDATASPPERGQLDRLARFAAQVPARAPAWKRWRWRVPVLALAIAGATVFALWLGARPTAVAVSFPTVPFETPVEDEDDPLLVAEVSEDDDFLVDDPLAALDQNGGESPLALLDLLTIPDDDQALERWSRAYASNP